MLEALAPLLVARAHTLNINELVIVLWSYGIFQHRPASEPHFLVRVLLRSPWGQPGLRGCRLLHGAAVRCRAG